MFKLKKKKDGGAALVVKEVGALLDTAGLSEDVKEKIKDIAVSKYNHVELVDGGLGPEGATAFAKALQCQPDVKSIRLANNSLGTEGTQSIAPALARFCNLQQLILRDNAIGLKGLQAIAQALHAIKNLRTLNLRSNSLDSRAAPIVADILKHHHRIKALRVDGNDFSPEGMALIADATRAPEKLKILTIGSSPVDDQQMEAVSSTKSNLPHLHLFVTETGIEAARGLGQGFPRSQDLTVDFKIQDEQRAFEAARPKTSAAVPVMVYSDDVDHGEKEDEDTGLLDENMGVDRGAGDTSAAQEQELMNAPNAIERLRAEVKALKQQAREKEELMDNLETRLSLNIPLSRFSNVKKARDHNNKVIRGANGVLYTATLGGHRVALKQVDNVQVRPGLVDILDAAGTAKNEKQKRLCGEASILLTIRHPNIVTFLGLCHDKHGQTLSFVLSWTEGGSLYDHMHVREEQLTKVQRARLAMEIAGAMEFLHAHGIVHRDLKSPNVLLDGSLSAKITGFELSTFRRADDEAVMHHPGTPLWASPEQLLELKLYADTDVFSFGVLYWELCFNCKPWHHDKLEGKEGTEEVIRMAYRRKEYLPVSEEINGVVLPTQQQHLLHGCFDAHGNRVDFSQLHEALTWHHFFAKRDEHTDERDQAEMLFGAQDAVWKFAPSLLNRLKRVAKQLTARPSVSIAPLDLQRDVDIAVVKQLLAEAGGATADQPNPLAPFGKKLAAVAITHDKQKEAAFNGTLARNQTRYRGHLTSEKGHPFSPKYKHNTSTKEPTNEEFRQILQRVTCNTTYKLLDPSLLEGDPRLRLQRVFRGVTSWDAVVGILGGDFASLQQVDNGWYGTGFYFTPDLDYALKYSLAFWKSDSTAATMPSELQHLDLDPSKEYRVVLACDVQYANPYPVLNHLDFKGKPLMAAHDAHVAVVKEPTTSTLGDAKPFTSYKEWVQQQASGRRPLAEIVLDDTSCVIVRALLVFQV